MTQNPQFKCPACLKALKEEEYFEASQEIRLLANEMARQIMELYISELEIEGRKLIRRINGKFAVDPEDIDQLKGVNN